jgi:hypothetical protein
MTGARAIVQTPRSQRGHHLRTGRCNLRRQVQRELRPRKAQRRPPRSGRSRIRRVRQRLRPRAGRRGAKRLGRLQERRRGPAAQHRPQVASRDLRRRSHGSVRYFAAREGMTPATARPALPAAPPECGLRGCQEGDRLPDGRLRQTAPCGAAQGFEGRRTIPAGRKNGPAKRTCGLNGLRDPRDGEAAQEPTGGSGYRPQ